MRLPVAALVLALTTPFHLVGLIELAVQKAAKANQFPRAAPLTLEWMIFLEGGGRWLLPVVAALLCLSGAHY